jgi:lipopolysaccharide heptosyltransferase II
MLLDPRARYERILSVRMDNIGDVIMLGPALRSIRAEYPQAHISLLASPAGSQVAPMLPWIDDVISWKALWQDVSGKMELDPEREEHLIANLRSNQYDLALIFTSFSQSPYPPAYVSYLAGIPNRVGLSKEFGGGVLTQWAKPPDDSVHQVDRDLAVLTAAGIPTDSRALELQVSDEVEQQTVAMIEKAGIEPEEPFIVAAPGASCAARRYPLERFSQLISILHQRVRMPILVIGSEREVSLMEPTLQETYGKGIVSLVGKTTIIEVAALVKRSAFVVANNSAALHIADAFQKPMVILYSGTEYRSQWAPRNSPAVLLKRETHCSPCYRFDCPYQMECLDLKPEEVADVAMGMIHRHVVNGSKHEFLSVEQELSIQNANKGTG